jgi:LuxR family maltose regulon positive regulatory protein
MVAALRGDTAAIAAHAHQALECLDGDNTAMRGVASTLLGSAAINQGDLALAEQTFVATVAAARAHGNLGLGLAVTEDLSCLQRLRGKLGAAIESCERVLAWSVEAGAATHPFAATIHLSLADMRRERNELAAAEHHVDEAFACSTSMNPLLSRVAGLFVRARVQGAQGQPEGALATLDEAADLAQRLARPWLSEVAPLLLAYRAQLWLGMDQLEAGEALMAQIVAADRAPQKGISLQFTIYTCEHLAMAPIQVLIARGRATGDPVPLQEALELAAQQQRQGETAGRPWQCIKAIALQALAWQALGQGEQGRALLQQAFAAAAPERYVRLFADEGAPMAALLASLPAGDAGGDVSAAYVHVVQAAIEVGAIGQA